MSNHRFIVQPIKKSHSHLHSIRMDKVTLTSNHKWTCWQKLTSWRRFWNLVMIYPPSRTDNFSIPSFWSTNCKYSGLFQSSNWRYSRFRRAFNNSWGSSSIIRMHIKISCLHITLYQQLILMWISTRYNEPSIGSYKPIEFFEPELLSSWNSFNKKLIFLFLDLLKSIFFSQF